MERGKKKGKERGRGRERHREREKKREERKGHIEKGKELEKREMKEVKMQSKGPRTCN